MTKRVCHSCRFFQAAGQDSMGWCTHPKRKLGSEVRIYVRANELPCRNDWSLDLWERALPDQADVVLGAVASPVPPATPEELGTLAALAHRVNPDETDPRSAVGGQDVVLGEVAAPLAKDFDSALEETRRLRRAHEELRARNRERRAGLEPRRDDTPALPPSESALWLAGDLVGRSAARAPGDLGVQPGPKRRRGSDAPDVSPVALGEMGRPFPKMTSFPDDDARFSSIPEPVDGIDLPFAQQQSKEPRAVHRAGFDNSDDRAVQPWVRDPRENSEISPQEPPSFEPIPAIRGSIEYADELRSHPYQRDRQREGTTGKAEAPDGSAERASSLRRPVEVDLANDGPTASTPPGTDTSMARSSQLIHRGAPERPDRERSVREDAIGDPLGSRAWPAKSASARETPHRPGDFDVYLEQTALDEDAAIEDERPLRPQRASRRVGLRRTIATADDGAESAGVDFKGQTRDRLTDDVETGLVPEPYVATEMLDLDSDIVAEEPAAWLAVPRMCATCRDFRPAENGERGWCTNKWAFSHRRMVDAEELPCETSIGGWWLPHDDHWMSAIDVTAHSAPTPLLDQWIAHRSASGGSAEHSPPMRRRQRS